MAASSPTLRVLVVDDDEDIADMLSLAFEVNGLEVAGVAHSGPEAVDLAERTQPDIVLLDQSMPRMSGLETVPELQAIAPRSKVCMHSAIGATAVTESALAAGVTGYIEKGVRPRSIVAHLRRMMEDGAGPVRPFPLRRDYS